MLKADVESQAWKMYVDYVDKMLVRGFVVMVNCSMQYLLANTEPTQKDALFEAKMELYVSGECLKFGAGFCSRLERSCVKKKSSFSKHGADYILDRILNSCTSF